MVSSFSLSRSAKQQLQPQAIENPSLSSHLERGVDHSIELPGAMLGCSFCIHGEGRSAQANPKKPRPSATSWSETAWCLSYFLNGVLSLLPLSHPSPARSLSGWLVVAASILHVPTSTNRALLSERGEDSTRYPTGGICHKSPMF